jgi:activator of HSP90 ATPase
MADCILPVRPPQIVALGVPAGYERIPCPKGCLMNSLTRREVSTRLLSTLALTGVARSALASAEETASNGVSRDCERIHQEIAFAASPARIYKALTDPKQFGQATELIMPGAAASTVISQHVGGEFSMFKGIIVGRHIEMVPNERLVQAWREKEWDAGVFSIVRFQLVPQGAATKIVFDHTGFPQGAADHLAVGWKSHYWEPLKKYLT